MSQPEIVFLGDTQPPSTNKKILRRLFKDIDKIYVKPISGGFGGAELFGVTPIKDNKDKADFVVKIGDKWEIEKEVEGNEIAKKSLQVYCATIDDKVNYKDKVGIKYTFGGKSPVKTFKEFYKEKNEGEVSTLLDKLFKVLGDVWYGKHNKSRSYTYREFYSKILPPDYEVKKGSFEDDTTVSELSALPNNPIFKRILLNKDSCEVLEIKPTKIKVKCGNKILDYLCNDLSNIKRGGNIAVRGVIMDTRDERFKRIKDSILAVLTSEEKREADNLPDPFKNLNSFLDRRYRTTSTIHHDLNVNNILVDKIESPWLIDFAKTTDEGHTAFDFAFLEIDIKRHILSEIEDIGLKEFIEIEHALYTNNSNELRTQEQIKAFKVIAKIRDMAKKYLQPDEQEDWYSIYFSSLATLKFEDAPSKAKKFAYFSAALALKYISLPEPPPPPPQPPPPPPPPLPDIEIAGRKKEIKLFLKLLNNNSCKVEVIWIYGPSGIGKSELMKKFCHIAEKKRFQIKEGVVGTWGINLVLNKMFGIPMIESPLSKPEYPGYEEYRTLSGVIEKLFKDDTNTIIAIDTTEDFNDYECLRRYIKYLVGEMERLRNRTFILIATQKELLPNFPTTDITDIKLEGLTFEEIKELIEIKGLDKRLLNYTRLLQEVTKGNPGEIITRCRRIDTLTHLQGEEISNPPEVIRKEWFRELSPERQKILIISSIVTEATASSS